MQEDDLPVKTIKSGWQIREWICRDCEAELRSWPAGAAELVKQDGEVKYIVKIKRGKTAAVVYKVYYKGELAYNSVAIYLATEDAVHRPTWTIGRRTWGDKELIEFYMRLAAEGLRKSGIEEWKEAFLTWAEPARELGIAPEKILEGLKNAPVCLPALART
ncbi:MAG: hypothetical protein ACP5I3_11945 [Thermoproteus sp.]